MLLVLLSILMLNACSASTPAIENGQAILPTPDVPPIEEIEAAMQRWEDSHGNNYSIEVDERTQGTDRKIRVVVVENQVQAAQILEKDASDGWGEPEALSRQQAQPYTVEGLFDRLSRDARGQGSSPINLRVTFSPSLGYPAVIDAEVLPTLNDDGKLVLNRQNSYDLTSEVKLLLQDTFNPNREAALTLVRSGGPEAWCDTLRVFEDGSSVYADECRREVLQLSLPDNRLEQLNNLRESFESLEDITRGDDQFQRLVIQGTGQGTANQATVTEAWDLAIAAYELLSEPIGLGLTLVYTKDDRILGFDTLNEATQPASLLPSGELRGASLSPDGQTLAFSDGEGLRYFDIQTGNITLLLPPPESGYYQPRAWSNAGFLFVTHVPGTDAQPTQHGWVTIAQPAWHDVPIPQDSDGYGCDTGMAWAPDSDRSAITGLGYGEPCNLNPGLSVVDLSAGSAQAVVSPVIDAGEGNTITAGAHTPAWSPDGEWIAFGLDQDAIEPLTFPTRLYRSRPDGSDLTPLTNNSQGVAAYPVWAPDGVIYYAMNSVSVEEDGLYQYDPSTNEHTLLINATGLHPLSVSPNGEFLLYEQEGGLSLWGFVRQSSAEVVPPQESDPAKFVGWLNENRE
jgi:WD40 repeat protein